MHVVAEVIIARGQPPAVGTVAREAVRIADAVLAIDQHMSDVLLPVVGIAVPQTTRIEPEEAELSEEQRAPEIRAERQGDPIEFPTIDEGPALRPAPMIDLLVDGVMGR